MSERPVQPKYTKLPTDQELRKGSYQEKIGKRYTHLRREESRLKKELKKRYAERHAFQQIFLDKDFPEETMKEIVVDWLVAVREQTDFLLPYDRLGVKVFVEDLADQPNYPDIKINFSSQKIRGRNMEALGEGFARGSADIWSGKIDLIDEKPSLNTQLATFLNHGTTCDPIATVTHELIHQKHLAEKSHRITKENREEIGLLLLE